MCIMGGRRDFFMSFCKVSLYIGLYKDVYVEDDHKAGFLIVCVVSYVQDKMKARMILTH